MKANELRIGNWVNSGINSTQAIEVYPMFIVQLSKMQDEEHNIKPIPITEEWLLKFGFEKVGDTYMLKITKLIYHCCYVRYVDDIWWFLSRKGATYDFKFNNVHQLQNLYFALTGKELEIK